MKFTLQPKSVKLKTLAYGTLFSYDGDTLPGQWILANERGGDTDCLTVRLSDGLVHRPTPEADVIPHEQATYSI